MPNNETYKRLSQAIKIQIEAMSEKLRAECEDCNNGVSPCLKCKNGRHRWVECAKAGWQDCPSCTPEYNRLMEWAKEFEYDRCKYEYICISVTGLTEDDCEACHEFEDATTVESIVKTLKALGVWERFIEWHGKQIRDFVNNGHCRRILVIDINEWATMAYAEILTDPLLLAQAVISFFK